MKRLTLLCMLIISLLVSPLAIPLGAATVPESDMVSGTFIIGRSMYWDNGVAQPMDAAPFAENGRTFVPVRYLANMLGMSENQINWDPNEQGITLDSGFMEVGLYMGDQTLYINGIPSVTMDVTPISENGRVFLPARWVAEAFGINVSYDSVLSAVNVIGFMTGLDDNNFYPPDYIPPIDDSDPITDPVTDPNSNTAGHTHPWSDWGLGKTQNEYVDNNNRGYDWYLDQMNTGSYSSVNCGPTTITMACKWSDPTFNRTPQEARQTYPGDAANGYWWTIGLPGSNAEMNNYLARYDIPYGGTNNSSDYSDLTDEMMQDLRDGNIIILCIDSSYITENQSNTQRTGKPYSSGRGSGHFILVKGFVTVDNQTFFEVYDPANGNEYYADGTPKCKDRYYSDDDIKSAMNVWWNNYLWVDQVDSRSVSRAAGKWSFMSAPNFPAVLGPVAYGGLIN